MERLTISDYGKFKIPPPAGTKEKERPSYMDLYQRLTAIEDILGDDYDLNRLREMMKLTKNIARVCHFCVGCEMEPKDGHGCDEYDSFVFSIERIKEIAKAVMDGKFVLLPVKEGTQVYRVQFYEFEDYPPEIFTFPFHITDYYKIGNTVFLTKEDAEKAIEDYLQSHKK